MILAKTDYAIFFIKIHYTYLIAPMDLIFSMYTHNSVKNDNTYINLNFCIIRGHIIRGKKLATPVKINLFCMYTQNSIISHIGYVHLIINVFESH